MKTNQNLSGFTLIELLVVVLIIGILSAVALPQYQKAVLKARMTEIKTVLTAVKKGLNLYELENGYPNGYVSLKDLDIEMPVGVSCETTTPFTCSKPNEWSIQARGLGTNWDIIIYTMPSSPFGETRIIESYEYCGYKESKGKVFCESMINDVYPGFGMELYSGGI